MATTVNITSYSDVAALTNKMKQVRNANFRGHTQHTDVLVPINDLRAPTGGAANANIICLSEMKWGDSVKSLRFMTPTALTALSFGISVFPIKDRIPASSPAQYGTANIIDNIVAGVSVRTGEKIAYAPITAKTAAGAAVDAVITFPAVLNGEPELITFDKTHKTLHELVVERFNTLAVADKEVAEETYYKYRDHPCMLCLVVTAATTIAANANNVLFSVDYVEQSPSAALNDSLTPRNSL